MGAGPVISEIKLVSKVRGARVRKCPELVRACVLVVVVAGVCVCERETDDTSDLERAP